MFSFLKKILSTPEKTELKVSENDQKTTVKFYVNRKQVFKRVFGAYSYAYKQFGDKLLIQLCNSKNEDAGMLYFINMRENKEIFGVIPEFGWESDFTLENGNLSVITKCGKFQLTTNGNLVNKVDYLKANINAVTHILVGCINELFSTQVSSDSDIKYYLSSLDKYIKKNEREFHALSILSSAYRMKGEIFESLNDHPNAYRAYKTAFDLDEKSGVKRALKKVAKSLDQEVINEIDSGVAKYSQNIIKSNKKIREKSISDSKASFLAGVKSGQIVIK